MKKLIACVTLMFGLAIGAHNPAQALSQCHTYTNGAASKWTRCDSYAGSWQYIATEVQCSGLGTTWWRGNRISTTSENSVVYCPSGVVTSWHLAIWFW